MKEYVILMADVIGSRGADQAELMLAFKKVVDQANGTLDFVSPLTITLGDEFQGVVNTVGEGVQAVVSGHSHKPLAQVREGVLYINPGSAGPRRFSLPISIGELRIDGAAITPRIVTLV